MIIFKRINELQAHLDTCRRKKQSIGFVPTMGALHEGHLSLLQIAKSENPVTVCSIFVNPTQFNDKKDFEKYPITIEKDIYMLETAGCDILFLPAVDEVYPEGIEKRKQFNLGYLETILEGEYRPGHFQGVCMVVEKLLNIVKPNHLYLGQKDFQQCMVITRLIELMGEKDTIHVRICPIVREKDGLAMSSRNQRLNPEQRALASAIYQTLVFLKQNIDKGSFYDLKKAATEMLVKKGFKPDYVEFANPETLKPVNEWDSRNHIVALIAAYMGEIRLIDNMLIS